MSLANVNYFHWVPEKKFVLFSGREKVACDFSNRQYLVDGQEHSDQTEAILKIFNLCLVRSLVPQLFCHLGDFPETYLEGIDVKTAHSISKQNRLLLQPSLAECACRLYDRFGGCARELMTQRMCDEMEKRFPKERTLRIMVLGSGRMAEVIFLTSILVTRGFRQIHYVAVEPDERHEDAVDKARALLGLFKKGGVDMEVSIDWHKDVRDIPRKEQFHAISAVDMDVLYNEFHADDTLGRTVSHLDGRGCAIFGMKGLNFEISDTGVEFIPPFIEGVAWYLDWHKRCDRALERCVQTLTVLIGANFQANFFPLIYLIDAHQKKHHGEVTLVVSDVSKRPSTGAYPGLFSRSAFVNVQALSSMRISKILPVVDVAFLPQPTTPLLTMAFQGMLGGFKSPSTIFTYSIEGCARHLAYQQTVEK